MRFLHEFTRIPSKVEQVKPKQGIKDQDQRNMSKQTQSTFKQLLYNNDKKMIQKNELQLETKEI